jgi:hypothetical protein
MGAFFADDSIKPEFVFWLEPNWKKYRGFHDFQVKGVNSSRFLEHDVYSLPKKLPWGEMVKADPNMVPWLDQMSEKGTWTSMGDTRSRVMRLCNTGCIANMDTQFNEIKKRYKGKFAIVEMHGGNRASTAKKGIRTYDPTTNETSEFNKNLSLTDAISLFNDPDKFPRILCIVGKMGDRCLSFVSNDYKLHLNEDYLTFPKTTVVGTMYQRMRMCGNNRGMGPLNLYITKSAYKDISKGLTSINDMIEYAQKKSCQSMRKSMTTMKMLGSKFSKRKLAASKFKEKVNKVQENDDGWGIDKYVQEIKDENGNVIETVPLIVEKDAAKKKKITEDDTTYLKNTAFPKWAKISCVTRIAKFMRSLDPTKQYTPTQLKDIWTGTESALPHFYNPLVPEKGKSKGYGVILQKNEDDTSQLRPDLVASYSEHFN